MRSLALARQCARRISGQHLLLLNSPFAPTLKRLIDPETNLLARILPAHSRPPEAGEFIRQVFREFQPDLFVVDTFPRGLGGELAARFAEKVTCKRVLISRHLPEAYV